MIKVSNFQFLKSLKDNNDRTWFADHKQEYLQEQQEIEAFADELLDGLNKQDVIETLSGKKSLYRIYRDTRFSKDKTPYKTHWSGSFKRAGKSRRGSYYFQLEPGNTFIGGGFWGPNADDLKLVRESLAFDAAPLREILQAPDFIADFKALQGDQLKTAPKGFDTTHPDIDLIRYKQFLLVKRFSDAEVLNGNFAELVVQTFVNMRPFLNYMSEILTTDANGLDL
ncbi:DUF2461 domain-containing protein [Pedobacter duraquae]|uniref:Uncharacterized protein (TIGR02453 family) n=1 Tax=Pedobacter duraquae TaxID=425511 RepID=A0A4R6IQS0_9SPHI|nr:DUF2461 domain-containing protein [Pedobacter duraquae]TDO24305.1 uncharacterized protein (TIGR02453 family) [Pedobacter duraquae]